MKKPEVIAKVSDGYQLQPCRGLMSFDEQDRQSKPAAPGCHVYACVDMFDSMGKACLRKRKHGTQPLPKSVVKTHQGVCPFALVKDSAFVRQIDLAVRASAWWRRFSQHNGRVLPHHLRFRVALAACPNACTMPQIRDIGIIATTTPQAIRSECTGCGLCEQMCREGAIVVRDGRAELQTGRCIGCGQCISNCPNPVIEPGPLRVRVLAGGRMGRHPRWAQDLCEVDIASAANVVRALLDCVAREMRPTEHMADAVERITIERLRQEISSAAECRASCEQTCPVSVCSEPSSWMDKNRG